MVKQILVVEDDRKIARIIELQLRHSGYDVQIASDGTEAEYYLRTCNYNLILLDVMLPKINGLELCRRIRETSNVPIIMLTAKDDVTDKVIGLDFGANDYITKPFEREELLARIRVQLRDNENTKAGNIIIIEDMEINIDTFQVKRGEWNIELSKREFELLSFLARNRGIVLKRERILQKVWGYDYFGSDNILDVYIKYVRDKVDKLFDKKLIETVRGVGYVIR